MYHLVSKIRELYNIAAPHPPTSNRVTGSYCTYRCITPHCSNHLQYTRCCTFLSKFVLILCCYPSFAVHVVHAGSVCGLSYINYIVDYLNIWLSPTRQGSIARTTLGQTLHEILVVFYFFSVHTLGSAGAWLLGGDVNSPLLSKEKK